MKVGGQFHALATLPQAKNLSTNRIGGGWTPGPVRKYKQL